MLPKHAGYRFYQFAWTAKGGNDDRKIDGHVYSTNPSYGTSWTPTRAWDRKPARYPKKPEKARNQKAIEG
jgi:hypothetical protein